ncbi:MAG: hypothetical protein A4S09_12750 [Proteobacteria bacterium SG_bin7]|nr:MAG: hypothetical protein A4S09_12750 [Proteobacteria bacterium SG_bin7]
MSFTGTIQNCFDSHVHWLATGQAQMRLLLRDLKSASEVKNLKVDKNFFRGEWLVGFGWDDNRWESRDLPTRITLDKVFPNFPVSFSRADGHALWVNTLALKLSGLWQKDLPDPSGGKIIKDESGWPTGVLIDMADAAVFAKIPPPSFLQIKESLLAGMNIFNREGFTHIRDMTCNLSQWNASVELDQKKSLTLAVEQYFNADDPKNFDRVLDFVSAAKKSATTNLRPKGLKVYFDGALGSEGALLSQCYCGKNHKGLQIISVDLLEEIMMATWDKSFELAVHAIGDAAAHLVLTTANKVWTKYPNGILHIEHAEILRPDSIALMKKQNVRCHLQPCHWLSDKSFLKDKIGTLFEHVFPWQTLLQNEIPFDFGSDSPIEPPSLNDNYRAVQELVKQGIGLQEVEVAKYQTHHDIDWTPRTRTYFHQSNVEAVFFRGEKLF